MRNIIFSKIGTAVGIFFSLCLVASLFLWSSHRTSTVYVSSEKVFNEFALTKQLKAKLENTQQTRQTILDSLERQVNQGVTDLQQGKASISKSDLQTLAQNLEQKKMQFAEDGEVQMKEYNEQIFRQLNQYLEEFRKEKHYDFILGINGGNTITAHDPDLDVSDKAIQFINQRYK